MIVTLVVGGVKAREVVAHVAVVKEGVGGRVAGTRVVGVKARVVQVAEGGRSAEASVDAVEALGVEACKAMVEGMLAVGGKVEEMMVRMAATWVAMDVEAGKRVALMAGSGVLKVRRPP